MRFYAPAPAPCSPDRPRPCGPYLLHTAAVAQALDPLTLVVVAVVETAHAPAVAQATHVLAAVCAALGERLCTGAVVHRVPPGTLVATLVAACTKEQNKLW